MYDPAIAEQLRALGHDVVAVKERPELQKKDDAALLQEASKERRAILTEDAAHFVPILQAMPAAGETTTGLLLSSPRSMPRSKRTIGLFVRTLDAYLRLHSEDDELAAGIDWLVPKG